MLPNNLYGKPGRRCSALKSHEFYKALIRLVCARDGGPGSGYFNHAGRPGKVGGDARKRRKNRSGRNT
nr:MAG TPA: hypothetical protein [Caudoviricetes sp.]DAK02343.1 MAG TPA: hypothetical protein [Caudoviricetes sp.]